MPAQRCHAPTHFNNVQIDYEDQEAFCVFSFHSYFHHQSKESSPFGAVLVQKDRCCERDPEIDISHLMFCLGPWSKVGCSLDNSIDHSWGRNAQLLIEYNELKTLIKVSP